MWKGEFYMENTKRLRLIVRIWSAIIIGVTLLILIGYIGNYFSTGQMDPNAVEAYPPIENIPPLLNLFSAVSLALAWKWAKIGGIITIILQLILLPIYIIHWPLSENIRYLIAPYGMFLVVIVPGILFFICSRRSKG